jgi:hypothetical protein
VNFDVRWDCYDEFLELYGGDAEDADEASDAVVRRLSRDPYFRTWELLLGQSDIRLTRIRPYKHHPAVTLSFRVVDEGRDRHCLILRARRSNDQSELS